MALTSSSILHYWSSRYGILPRVGGRPVFTRSSSGTFTTQEGEVNSALPNSPRADWKVLNLPNGLTENRRLLTLELARTNANTTAIGSWTADGASVTAGQADPAGGSNAIVSAWTGGNGRITATASFTGDGTKAIALAIRAGTASASYVLCRDATAVVERGGINITWTNGVPSLAGRSGSAVYPVTSLTGGWYLVSFSCPSVVAANSNKVDIASDANGTSKSMYIYRPNFENGAFATSLMDPSVSRATDSLYWNFPPVPQAMMVYVRFVEQGTVLTANARLAGIGASAEANPEFLIYQSGTYYAAYQHNGTASVISAAAVAPAIGDTCELVHILFADGSVQIIQSINGAAVTSGTQSAANALPAAWSDTKLWANSGGTAVPGAAKFAEIKIVKYADVVATTAAGRMSELQGLELGPQGDIL